MPNLRDISATWLAAKTQVTDGRDIVHYPAGQIKDKETVSCIFVYGKLDPITDEDGRIRQRANLIVPIATSVAVTRGLNSPSTWAIDGEVWVTKDIVRKDIATHTFEIWKVDQKHTQRANQ